LSTDETHPDREALARYVRGALGRGESRALERHLAGCLACQAAVEEMPAAAGAVVRWAGHRFAGRPEPPPDPVEEARLARLRGVLAEVAGVVGTLGEAFAARLLAESEHGRRAMIRADARFRSAAVCAALLARCREAWLDDPVGAIELAKLAVAVAGHLDPAGGADAWKPIAWMHLGNAYGIASRGGPPAGSEVAEPPAGPAAASLADEGPPLPPEEAEAALREVEDAFLERGLDRDAALVVLERAGLLLRLGLAAGVAPLAEVEAVRLEAAGARAETFATLRRLAKAAHRGDLTPAWLAAAAADLRRTPPTGV
jgi:putative zinc finger protein